MRPAFREIIRRNGVILAALGKTPYFHEDEALAIAGLLIREISEVSEAVRGLQRYQLNRVCFPPEVKERVYALYHSVTPGEKQKAVSRRQ